MITMTSAQLWVLVVSLAACAGAAWVLIGAAGRRLARSWRKTAPAAPAEPAAPVPLLPGTTMHVPPCGCIHYFHQHGVERCPHHAAQAAEHAVINQLDQQIRRMP